MTPSLLLRSSLLPPICAALLTASACRHAPSAAPAPADPIAAHLSLPQPTEHRLDEDAEARNKQGRREWIASMHRAAPGVDWKAIERENGRTEMDRRNFLATAMVSMVERGTWSEVGSRNQAGRMHCAVIGPATPDAPQGRYLYAGSSLGGVWRGNPDGTGWIPMGDNLYGGAHHLAVIPGALTTDPEIVLAATDGGALHVTRDGGQTWEDPLGLPVFSSVRDVAVLEDATHTMLVLGRYGGGTQWGIFASTNGGLSFSLRWNSSVNWPGSMWVPRTGAAAANTVYLLQRGRVQLSTDGGQTFSTLATVDATAGQGRITGSEAGAPTIYVALKAGGQWDLYRSDDTVTYNQTHAIGDFWESLCASTTDPDVVIYGGVETWRSTNGGVGFQKINAWGDYYGDPVNKLHADIPGLYCWPDPADPLFSDIWYICTDGGLYRSTDSGAHVRNLSLSGLGVSQYYTTLTSSNRNELILAGSQDQGYQRGVYGGFSTKGPSTDFDQLISGDYGHLTSRDGAHHQVYCTYPGFIMVQEGQQNPQLLYPFLDFPSGSDHAWLPPVVADPLDYDKVFFLGDKLYLYTQVSGPSFSQTVHSAHNFLVGSASYLTAMAFAPSDAQRAYAVNNRGRLFVSGDHGVTWTNSASTGPSAHYFYGNTIAVNPADPMESVVGGSGYSAPGVYRTTDGGTTWSILTAGLPSTMVFGLAYARDGSGDVFAATEAGAWGWDQSAGAWVNIMHPQTPITTYWSVETLTDGRTVRFGTYGRGIWDYSLPRLDTPTTHAGPARWVTVPVPATAVQGLHLAPRSLPRSGQEVGFVIRAGQAGRRTGTLHWSTRRGNRRLASGSFLVGAPRGGVRFELDARGHCRLAFPIPADTFLLGRELTFQATLDAPRTPGGLILSNALRGTIGH